MKTITIDDELYAYIASQTKHIGENASDILRRLLLGDAEVPVVVEQAVAEDQPTTTPVTIEEPAETNLQGGVFALVSNESLASLGSRVEQFLAILAALAQHHGEEFAKVLTVKGRNRLYFATQKEQLLEAGSSTNPKQVPNSEYWVVTNNNTAKKVSMLKQAAAVLGYSDQDAQTLAALFAPELN